LKCTLYNLSSSSWNLDLKKEVFSIILKKKYTNFVQTEKFDYWNSTMRIIEIINLKLENLNYVMNIKRNN